MAADIGNTVDRITAGKSESTLSKREMGLTENFIPQVRLVPVYTRVMDYILRGWQTCRDRSVIRYDVSTNSTREL